MRTLFITVTLFLIGCGISPAREALEGPAVDALVSELSSEDPLPPGSGGVRPPPSWPRRGGVDPGPSLSSG